MRYGLSLFAAALCLSIFVCAAPALPKEAPLPTCIECHASMQDQPKVYQPVEKWRGSVHAKNGISCNGCHGGDPTIMDEDAMSPDKGFKDISKPEAIPDFCGACHLGVKEDYLASAHGKALGRGGPQCATCHGAHGIQLASPQLINPKSCTRCHSYERAEQIREALATTDERISALDRELKDLHRMGMEVGDLQGGLFDTRNTFHRLFHSVDVQKVRGNTADILGRLSEINRQMEAIQAQLSHRKRGGAVVVGLLAVLAALLLYLRHTYSREEKSG